MTTAPMSKSEIRTLRRAASDAGDIAVVALCHLALGIKRADMAAHEREALRAYPRIQAAGALAELNSLFPAHLRPGAAV